MSGGIKRGKEINVCGWTSFIENPNDYPDKPEGYSTVPEIALRLGLNRTTLNDKMKYLRENKKVKAMKVRNKQNKIVWAYKD